MTTHGRPRPKIDIDTWSTTHQPCETTKRWRFLGSPRHNEPSEKVCANPREKYIFHSHAHKLRRRSQEYGFFSSLGVVGDLILSDQAALAVAKG